MNPLILFLLLNGQVPERPMRTQHEDLAYLEGKEMDKKVRTLPMDRSPTPVEINVSIHALNPILEGIETWSSKKTYKRGMDPEVYTLELIPVNSSVPNIRIKAQRPITKSPDQDEPTPMAKLIGELPQGLPPCRGLKVFDPKGVYLGQRLFDVDQELPTILLESGEDGWFRVTVGKGSSHMETRLSFDEGRTWDRMMFYNGGVFQQWFEDGGVTLSKKPMVEFLVIKDLRYERRRIKLDGFKTALITT